MEVTVEIEPTTTTPPSPPPPPSPTNHASRQSNSVSSSDSSKPSRVLRQRVTKLKIMKRRKLVHTPSSCTQLPTKSFLPMPSRHQENVGHIRKLQIGAYIIDVWYLAPYPEEYSKLEVLHVCEYCLKYMKSAYIAIRHKVSLEETRIKYRHRLTKNRSSVQ